MSNALKYIRSLEAAGFERAQAEAQVQMVLDAIEGDLATKADLKAELSTIQAEFASVHAKFASVHAELDSVRGEFKTVRSEISAVRTELKSEIMLLKDRVESQFRETELRLVTKLGLITATTTSLAVAFLGWLIKV